MRADPPPGRGPWWPLLVVVLLAAGLGGCTARGGEASGAELFARIRPSLALISTPTSTGSAELIDGGYLVTDAHVVDPYRRVDVQFEGKDWIEHVPVVGVDLVADLAVVGPVRSSAPPLEIQRPASTRGGRAYLMGFPGDQVEAHAKLHAGRLAGEERAEHWSLDFVRSTTKIPSGQSGGALVDGEGRVIGVSGLEADDGMALSVRGDEVMASVRKILAGHGSPWESEANPATRRRFTVESGGPYDAHAFHVVAEGADRTVRVTVKATDGQPMVAVSQLRSARWPTRASSSVRTRGDDSWWSASESHALRTAGPGTWQFDLAAFSERIVTVSSTADSGQLSIAFSTPVVPVEVEDPERPLAVPGGARAYLDAVDDDVPFVLRLRAGEPVRITARTPSGDAEWQVAPYDGGGEGDERTVSGGGGGLFGTDASGRFIPDTTGRYLLWVYDLAESATAVDVQVAAG